MTGKLKNNSYHILGLDTSASQREVLKRSKEIINRLKIDDLPVYDLDLDIFENFRTEESVKEAVQKLSSPKKRIKEYFFWFQIVDSVDEQAAGLLKSKEYAEASRVWENSSEKDTAKSLLYKKNLAILHCLLLFKKDSKTNLEQSLKLWRELIDSDKFWIAFAKVYKLHDELGTNQEIINEFKLNAVSYVADIYTELGQFHNNNAYVAESSKILEAKGAATEKTVLNPIYQSVAEAVDQLESLKVSADGVIDKNEAQTIKVLIGKIQEEFNKLIELGLYEDSQSKTIRDRAANAIRVVVLDLHNNLSETDKALAKFMMSVSGIPTGTFRVFSRYDEAVVYVVECFTHTPGLTLFIKASGLASGKGAYRCETLEKAQEALWKIMVGRVHQDAGDNVLVEECIPGQEISIHALADGKSSILFPPADQCMPIPVSNSGFGNESKLPFSTTALLLVFCCCLEKKRVNGRETRTIRRRNPILGAASFCQS